MNLAPTGGPGLGWWVPHVAEPPELIHLKCPNYHLHALQQSNLTVYRVKSRCNHYIFDRNNIPHTKVSPEITIAINFTAQTSTVNVITN